MARPASARRDLDALRTETSMVKLAILYSEDVVNNAMVRRLQDRFGSALKVRERRSTADVLRRTLRRKRDSLPAKLDKLAFYTWYFLALKGGLDALLRRTFGGGEGPAPDLEVGNINAPEAIAAVKAHAPEVIVVSGTRILKSGWMELGAPVLNAHFGMAPRYRGRFCWFWPVVEAEHDWIGRNHPPCREARRCRSHRRPGATRDPKSGRGVVSRPALGGLRADTRLHGAGRRARGCRQ